jgi:formate/nitrite transporter FocA (FNT family)
VLRLWTTVLAANLAGALLFAVIAAWTPMFQGPVKEAFDALGSETVAPSFGTVLVRGIFAGWLIALMVWLLPFAETGRVAVIVILTYIVGLGHFSHVIAGSVEAMYVVARGGESPTQFVAGFLVPSLIGNVIGGVSLVAALAHAQFVAGAEATELRSS